MLKVCMIVQKYYHTDSRVRRYAEALASAGAMVDILCLPDPNQPAEPKPGIRLFPIPLQRPPGNFASYLLNFGAGLALFSIWLLPLFLKNRYEIIHIHNMPDFLIFAALIPRFLGAKLILDIHDPMPEIYQSKYQSRESAFAVRVMRAQEKVSSWYAHAIIAANSNFKQKLVSRGIASARITVINNWPDPAIFNRARYRRPNGNRPHFTLIYPGTIAPRYGLAVAIHALPQLASRISGIQLVIVGEELEYVNELRRLAQDLGVSRFIQFKPHIPVEEVARQLMEADVGIYPALPDPHMSIAMPVKISEYLAMGLPVIASRLKVLEDSYGNSVMFFEPGDPEDFARCVLELYRNPTRRDEMVREADCAIGGMQSWRIEQRIYFDLLNRVISSVQRIPSLSAAE